MASFDKVFLSKYNKINYIMEEKFKPTSSKHNYIESFNTSESSIKKSSLNRRFDKFGIPILKMKKLHKVSFSDQFPHERNLVEEIMIESFKTYNIINDDESKWCLSCRIY